MSSFTLPTNRIERTRFIDNYNQIMNAGSEAIRILKRETKDVEGKKTQLSKLQKKEANDRIARYIAKVNHPSTCWYATHNQDIYTNLCLEGNLLHARYPKLKRKKMINAIQNLINLRPNSNSSSSTSSSSSSSSSSTQQKSSIVSSSTLSPSLLSRFTSKFSRNNKASSSTRLINVQPKSMTGLGSISSSTEIAFQSRISSPSIMLELDSSSTVIKPLPRWCTKSITISDWSNEVEEHIRLLESVRRREVLPSEVYRNIHNFFYEHIGFCWGSNRQDKSVRQDISIMRNKIYEVRRLLQQIKESRKDNNPFLFKPHLGSRREVLEVSEVNVEISEINRILKLLNHIISRRPAWTAYVDPKYGFRDIIMELSQLFGKLCQEISTNICLAALPPTTETLKLINQFGVLNVREQNAIKSGFQPVNLIERRMNSWPLEVWVEDNLRTNNYPHLSLLTENDLKLLFHSDTFFEACFLQECSLLDFNEFWEKFIKMLVNILKDTVDSGHSDRKRAYEYIVRLLSSSELPFLLHFWKLIKSHLDFSKFILEIRAFVPKIDACNLYDPISVEFIREVIKLDRNLGYDLLIRSLSLDKEYSTLDIAFLKSLGIVMQFIVFSEEEISEIVNRFLKNQSIYIPLMGTGEIYQQVRLRSYEIYMSLIINCINNGFSVRNIGCRMTGQIVFPGIFLEDLYIYKDRITHLTMNSVSSIPESIKDVVLNLAQACPVLTSIEINFDHPDLPNICERLIVLKVHCSGTWGKYTGNSNMTKLKKLHLCSASDFLNFNGGSSKNAILPQNLSNLEELTISGWINIINSQNISMPSLRVCRIIGGELLPQFDFRKFYNLRILELVNCSATVDPNMLPLGCKVYKQFSIDDEYVFENQESTLAWEQLELDR